MFKANICPLPEGQITLLPWKQCYLAPRWQDIKFSQYLPLWLYLVNTVELNICHFKIKVFYLC